MKLISIGGGNFVSGERIISVTLPDSAPIKRTVQEARGDKRLIDATNGRKTQSVIICDSSHIIVSYFTPTAIAEQINGGESDKNE